ncbi:MAG: class I SAM-dependent rRNA methyltransferase [Elusimicrobia bacterium]|nr:class I SAM-dependent rRNA methyltransferase [Elusimicrobiota bacterium]MDE2424632.1 class I SAM-dependent rRNA methyltransferase [Elusimicrobiota bacterium]
MPVDPAAAAGPLTVRLKPAQERRVLAGHAWVFSNEIASVEGEGEPGALARVLAADGTLVGAAFYNPRSLIACRMLALGEMVEPDAAFFHSRLSKALAFRQRLKPGGTAYRLCFGESDGLPGLVVDRYDSVLVAQVLSAGIERRLEALSAALQELLKPEAIFLKNDHRARALEGLPAETRVLFGRMPERVEIEEGGLRFVVPLAAGQKTGFYFDQAENRLFLRPYFEGRIVLDLYCYTGAFALNAAKSGAKAVLGIDSSAQAVELARENAALNGAAGLSFEEDDAEAALRSFSQGSQPFQPDMILLDPPSLVPSKKHLAKALRAYGKLNAQALRALPKGGLLASSTCSHHVSREIFVELLRLSAAKAQVPARLLALRGQAGDHPVLLAMPETEYLHFALLERL